MPHISISSLENVAKPFIGLHEHHISPYPFLFLFLFFKCSFWLHHTACRLLVPANLGLNPRPSAVKVLSLNQWTTRELRVLCISKLDDGVNVLVLRKLGFFGFPGGPAVMNLLCNAGDTSLIPGPGRSHMPQDN